MLRVMTAVAVLVSLLACLSVAVAGDVNFTWDASPGATGYKVYVGTQSRSYGSPLDVPGGSTTVASVSTLPDGCVQLYGAVTAYNAIGESDYSDEVVFFPRPLLVGEPAINSGNLVLSGGNFAPSVTVRIDGNQVDSTRVSCEQLLVPVTSIPTVAQGVTATMEVCNGPVCLTKVLMPSTKPTNVSVN